MSRFIPTDETIASIREMESSGAGINEIREALGVPRSVILKYALSPGELKEGQPHWQRSKKVSPNTRRKIAEMYQSGVTCQEIAALLNLSVNTVRYHLRGVGRDTPWHSRKMRKLGIAEDDLRGWIEGGLSQRAIAKKLNVSTPVVVRLLQGCGLTKAQRHCPEQERKTQESIRDLVDLGVPVWFIARRIKSSPSTVQKQVKGKRSCQ